MNEYSIMMAELTLAGLEKRKPNILFNIDEKELIKRAKEQHMKYLWLVPTINAGVLSDESRLVASSIVMQSMANTVNQSIRYHELHKAFEDNGIRNLLVKGILLKDIYPSREMREMGDIDILVYQDDIEKCRCLMPQLGYTLVKDVGNHEIVYASPEGVIIEVHKALYSRDNDVRQYEYFCDRTKDVLLDGCRCTYTYNVNDMYIYLIAHMARHFYARGCGVRGLVDIYVYRLKNGSHMDNQYIYSELEKIGIRTFAEHMERMAMIWLKGERSSELYDNIIEYMLGYGAYGSDANGVWCKFSRANNKDTNLKRVRMKYYFPSVNYLLEYYPVLKRMPFLLPFIWVKRGVNGIAKKGSGQRAMLVATMEEDTVRKMAQIYDCMEMDFQEDDD